MSCYGIQQTYELIKRGISMLHLIKEMIDDGFEYIDSAAKDLVEIILKISKRKLVIFAMLILMVIIVVNIFIDFSFQYIYDNRPKINLNQ
jgi:hypothetical protein